MVPVSAAMPVGACDEGPRLYTRLSRVVGLELQMCAEAQAPPKLNGVPS